MMRGRSPPGSTIAARSVAVQATIEQFCANGVTGTTVTLRACIMKSEARMNSALYRKPGLLCEVLERCLGPRTEMLDHFGGGERAELGGSPVVLIARKPDQEPRGEQIARAGGIDELVDRRRVHDFVAFARHDHAAFFAARHH